MDIDSGYGDSCSDEFVEEGDVDECDRSDVSALSHPNDDGDSSDDEPHGLGIPNPESWVLHADEDAKDRLEREQRRDYETEVFISFLL